MNRQYYDWLGVSEGASDEEIEARYRELKKKYSEDRFLEGEAGNEAARMLNRIETAYAEIMTERRERRSAAHETSSYARVEQLIREGKIAEAQAALDEFNERPAEWHYLQSVVFYRKSWINESKKQLEIALQMDGSNEKYRTAYNKLKERSTTTSAARRPRRRGRASSAGSPTTRNSRRWAAGSASSAPPAVPAICS